MSTGMGVGICRARRVLRLLGRVRVEKRVRGAEWGPAGARTRLAFGVWGVVEVTVRVGAG